jgi:hypothetical protein
MSGALPGCSVGCLSPGKAPNAVRNAIPRPPRDASWLALLSQRHLAKFRGAPTVCQGGSPKEAHAEAADHSGDGVSDA